MTPAAHLNVPLAALAAALASLVLVACAPSGRDLPAVYAAVETAPVASADDAADDPAIWVNADDPAGSLILGTDKQAGLYVYDLQGRERQFLPAGLLNNVDLRQNVRLGDWTGDVAAASNRADDTVALFTIGEDGRVAVAGAIASPIAEPYGACMGRLGMAEDAPVFAFIAYKTGDLIAFRLTGPDRGEAAARVKLASQLEGCVFDDAARAIYIGEEERGIWKAAFNGAAFSEPVLVDEVGGESGVAADVEGLALYHGADRALIVASSQGNDSYAFYDMKTEAFLGRVRIADGPDAGGIDGAEETDGVEAIAVPLGPDFPKGVLVVQDGHNRPKGAAQNFKIVDWRDIEAALGLTP